jgi:transglutaminase-like putative cysteine protease
MLAFEGWWIELAEGKTEVARLGAATLLESIVGVGAGYARDVGGDRLFDPVEVDQFLGWLSTTGDLRWRERKTITNAGIIADARSSGLAYGGGSKARFHVAFRRSFDLVRLERGAPVRLRIPLPLPSFYHEDFRVAPVAPAEIGLQTSVSEGRLEMRLSVPSEPVITIGMDLDVTALPPAGRGEPLTSRDAELYLRASEGVIQVTRTIAELANEIAGSSPPEQAVAAFIDYIDAAFRGGFVRYDEISAAAPFDLAFKYKVIDCKLVAALLISLCRARGIPARLINGYFLYRHCPSNHSWVEIWMQGIGWAPFDSFNRERYQPDAPSGSDWWAHFSRRTGDYRLAVERLPLDFTGPMSVRFPPAWQILQTAGSGGADLTFIDISDGGLIYRDNVVVERIG